MKAESECVGPNDTLAAAAQVMRRNEVLAVPVLDHHQPAGVLTDRKIETHCYAVGRNPAQLRVREAMDNKAAYLHEDDEPSLALEEMKKHGAEQLPVFNTAGKVVGIVFQKDIETTLSASSAR